MEIDDIDGEHRTDRGRIENVRTRRRCDENLKKMIRRLREERLAN